MIFMGVIEHGWNICLLAFGLGGLCVTFGWVLMRILFAVTTLKYTYLQRSTCAHGKVELLFGAAQKHLLCAVLDPKCNPLGYGTQMGPERGICGALPCT